MTVARLEKRSVRGACGAGALRSAMSHSCSPSSSRFSSSGCINSHDVSTVSDSLHRAKPDVGCFSMTMGWCNYYNARGYGSRCSKPQKSFPRMKTCDASRGYLSLNVHHEMDVSLKIVASCFNTVLYRRLMHNSRHQPANCQKLLST